MSEETKLKMDPLALPRCAQLAVSPTRDWNLQLSSTLQEILMAPWADPVQSFFESFEGFVYDPDAAPAALFNELAREQGWVLGTREHKQALERLQEAQFRRFDPSYGNAEHTTEFNEYDDDEELTPAEWAFISDYKNSPQGDDPTAIHILDQQIAEISLESTVGHLDAFFAKYPGFERTRKESVSTQLNKLRKHERWWGERRHLWDDALQEYRMALVQEFNTVFGTDENNLKNWHRLLSRFPGASLPGTIDECKSVSERHLHRTRRVS